MVARHIDTGFALPSLAGGNAVRGADTARENGEHQRNSLRPHVVDGMDCECLKGRHDERIAGQHRNSLTKFGMH